jgi:hypothetical protein
MASYLSLFYQGMENVFQELDAIVKNEFASMPFIISPPKVESHAKKPMINQQVSLASQVLKNPNSDNAQHVPEIVELDDFDTKETKVAKKQPLKCLKKMLILLEAYEKENKHASPIKIHEKDSQIN